VNTHAKISPRILHLLAHQPQGTVIQGGWSFDKKAMAIDTQGLQVYIELEAFAPEVVEALETQGLSIEVVEPTLRLIQARLPLDRVEAVSQLPFVKFIRLPDYGYPNQQGAVGTEGDPVMRADIVRQQLAVTGAGIRVGVISDGIDGLSQSVASGDLPAQGVTSRSFRADGNVNAGAEGTAILEIIHDVAPGAQLFFANFATSLEFIQAVNWLTDEAGGPTLRRGTPGGVDILVGDIAFFNTGPYDGSSPVSQALANAVVRGVAVFTAVGNYAQAHYQGLYTDTDGDTLHEFDVSLGLPQVNNAGETLNVTVQPAETIAIYLQWNDPFGASSNDYDLCVYDPPDQPTSPLFCSDAVQNGTGDPTESLVITRTAPTPGTLGVGIINVQGRAAPRILDMFIIGGVMDEFIVPDSSVPNVGDSFFAVSVGAVNWQTPGAVESFSSRGPTNDGRLKPELVAPDGVSVTGSGGFPSPFFGTSASAPHAGALAALVLSVDPTLNASALTARLTATALPLGAPLPNNIFGYGRADAFTALGPVPLILGDYDGDGRADIAVRDPQTSTWYILESSTGQLRTMQFGWAGLVPVPGDYDGDGRTDIAAIDPLSATWYILESSTGQLRTMQFGWAGLMPVPGDYDGDGRTDIAARDPQSSTWYILESSTGRLRTVQFGWSALVPVPGDYDGDGRADIAVRDPQTSTWYILESSTGQLRTVQFGWAGLVPVPGDYDGDGRTDIAAIDPLSATWYILESRTGQLRTVQFGWSALVPALGDFDGDGRTDIAALDHMSSTWYILESRTGQLRTVQFGWSAAVPP
jgi:hypothetical protein